MGKAREWLSEFYLRLPGYALRNVIGDLKGRCGMGSSMNLIEVVQEAQRVRRPFRSVLWQGRNVWCEIHPESGELVRQPYRGGGAQFCLRLKEVLGEWEMVSFAQLRNEALARAGLPLD